GRKPLWEMCLPQIQDKEFVPILAGGTAMVTVKQVAEATVGAPENGTHGSKYAISELNMKHQDFFQLIADVLGQAETIIQVAPLDNMKPTYAQIETLAAQEDK